MTFKAVFPDILRRPAWFGPQHPEAGKAGFGLQHTDFTGRCQRFTEFVQSPGKISPGGPLPPKRAIDGLIPGAHLVIEMQQAQGDAPHPKRS
jgi:hypothetical protein